ncbi:hypothetical protein F5I97DRAFT_1813774 [Phlebopus sp. FC_14]|nr:hypothetical protein F5I97DRAFT_1813774 [Phlebopus sp. FC_14]
MALVKIPFLLATALALHVSVTAPGHANPTHGEKKSMLEATLRASQKTVTMIKCIYWTGTLAETASILAAWYAHRCAHGSRIAIRGTLPMLHHALTTLTTDTVTPVNPLFIAGSVLAISGGLVRLACYRALGRFFTFRLGTFPSHALITSGPYAVVRHPSYTGFILCFLGVLMVNLSPGSWLNTSGVLGNVWVRGVVGTWILLVGGVSVSVVWRCKEEDAMLRERFGVLWVRWAQEVRYRLLPGIY